MRANEVVFHGYLGLGNLGDEVMLEVLLRTLQRKHPKTSATVLLARGGDPALLLHDAGGQVSVLTRQDWPAIRKAFGRARGLFWTGGTCLHAHGACGLPTSVAARLRGCPVFWLGIGADPTGSAARALKARFAVRLTSGITVRDPGSAVVIRGLGGVDPAVGYDIAFLAPHLGVFDEATSHQPSSELVLAVRAGTPSVPGGGMALGRALLSGIRDLLERDHGIAAVRAVSLATLVDGQATEELGDILASGLPGVPVNVSSTPHPREMLTVLAGAAAVVSMRMHGWLLARMLGRPAVGIVYASKVSKAGDMFSPPPLVSGPELVRDPTILSGTVTREMLSPAPLRLGEVELRHGADRSLAPLTELLAL